MSSITIDFTLDFVLGSYSCILTPTFRPLKHPLSKDDKIYRSLAKNSLKSFKITAPILGILKDFREFLVYSSKHQKWLPFQTLGFKTVKNVNSFWTTEIMSKKLNVTS